MLPPEQIDALNVLIPNMVEPITDFLIQDIARRVAEAGQFTSTAAYQLWKIQKLGLSRKQALKELKKQLGLTEDELNSLIQEAAEQGYAYDLKRLGVKAVPFAENENLQQIVNAAVKLADKDFKNITQSLGMIDPMGHVMPLKDIYNSCCDFAFNSVQTGATDVETAVHRACRELANKGLRTIDYESGIHTSLEAAVRRNIMGGLGLMGEKISEENHDKLGADGWEISAHAMCAPDHEAIQGKQFTDEEFEKLNEGLKRRIGTLHCGHVKIPIFIGISKPVYTDKQLEQFKEDNAKGVDYEGRHFKTKYEAVQFQKYIERSIRTQERRILTAKATGNEDYLQKCEVKYRVLTAEYNKFSKTVGLKTRYERLFVAGFSNSRETRMPKIKTISKKRPTKLKTTSKPKEHILTKQEKESAEWYVSGEGQWINQYLRGRTSTTLSNGEKELLKGLESLTESGIVKEKVLYRGVDAEAIFGKMSQMQYEQLTDTVLYGEKSQQALINKTIGKEITEKGFMSTTKDKETAIFWDDFTGSEKPVVLELDVPKNIKGYDMKQFEVKGEEQHEVLLAKNQKYEITEIRKEKYRYEDELGEGFESVIYIKAKLLSN